MSISRSKIFACQKALVVLSYALARPLRRFGRRVDWIVGMHEVASMVFHVGEALPHSYTIVDRRHAFYAERYDAVIQAQQGRWASGRWAYLRIYFLGAVLLGVFLARARGVVYVGHLGFLQAGDDEREWELRFIRSRRKHAVVIFTGNEIRSPRQMTRLAEETGFDNIGSILAAQGEPFDTDAYEEARRRRSSVSERLASAVFTARVDQCSYLTSPTHPFPYLYPHDRFLPATSKFEAPERIRVVHAPSKPTLKGTEHIRAAMRNICARHPNVDYVELIGVGNAEVLETLTQAHIVVNQLHAYMPGIFGIEAMAHRCVMVCSADPAVETDLTDAEGAWVVANPQTLESVVEELVSHPERLAAQAERGWQWAREHASQDRNGERLTRILESLT